MKIKSIRRGFANNSSSTHSIIFVKDEDKVANIEDEGEIGEYGWNFFTAKTREAKEAYLFINMVESIAGKRPIQYKFIDYNKYLDLKKQAIVHLLELNAKYFSFFSTWDDLLDQYKNNEDFGYVDHQSVIDLPLDKSGNQINFEFYADFCKELLKPNYLILGGNDNTDESHELWNLNSGLPEFIELLANNTPY